jgi:hypothetical protein
MLVSVHPQPHTQLMCTTTAASGLVRITTAGGSVTVDYSAALLLLPPIVNSVTPATWSTTEPTPVTIAGELA